LDENGENLIGFSVLRLGPSQILNFLWVSPLGYFNRKTSPTNAF
jgi:hypothetical protein